MTGATGYAEVRFSSEGVECRGRHFRARGEQFATPAGRPVVVMAHGLAGTVDSGLEPFAAGLSEAGLDVLAFDYRGFGLSDGRPRQAVSTAGQVADYRAAMGAAAALAGVDGGRLVLWGVSLSGGHVLAAAAGRADVAAVVSLTPLVDGPAAGRHALGRHPPVQLLRTTAAGVRSRICGLLGRPPVLIPATGPPGSVAALTLPGCYQHYLSLAGPSWRNSVDAAVIFEIGRYRPGRAARLVPGPVLVQIADLDRSAPPRAAARAAFRARAEVRHYPCDHWDVWPGRSWFEPALAHQLAFLTRVLAPASR
jgi:pimeloyl-ACP methyl ester carboxylesterase